MDIFIQKRLAKGLRRIFSINYSVVKMPKGDKYICPRCFYETPLKKNMNRHLYELKRPCTDKTGLELTDQIRDHVLKNKHYTIAASVDDRSRIRSQNFNQILGNMETICKLNHCLEYYGKRITNANEYLETLHNQTITKLYEDSFQTPHLIGRDNIMMLVDDLARVNGNNHEEMNVMYDEMLDRIKIYVDDQWETHMIEPGLRRIIEILRSNILDQYECYLFRKLYDDKKINATQLNDVRLHLQLYYRFLGVFDLFPLVYTERIENIVFGYKSDNPNEFHDFGMEEYNSQKKELTKPEINRTKKEILDIIRKNYKVNLKKLNESILELLNIDANFRSKIRDEITL